MFAVTQPDAAAVLTAMITPSVLISAIGLLVLSTSARLGRVVDRIRRLLDDVETLAVIAAQSPLASAAGSGSESPLPPSVQETEARFSSEKSEKLRFILNQLEPLSQRMLLLRTALFGLYASIAFLVATSMALGVTVVLLHKAGWLPVVIGLFGAAAFLYSILLLVREASLAVGGTQEEAAYIHELVERQRRLGQKNG